MRSFGPPSAERAGRNRVCAVAHTKGAGILRLRSGGLLSGAHRRASVDARSRRTPALDLPAEASFDCARRVGNGVTDRRGRRSPLRMLAQTIGSLVSEQHALAHGRAKHLYVGRAGLTGRERDPSPGRFARARRRPMARLRVTRRWVSVGSAGTFYVPAWPAGPSKAPAQCTKASGLASGSPKSPARCF